MSKKMNLTRGGLPARVAIHVADPYVAGVYTLIWEMRDGLRELGIECDITTSSKSGKTTVRWGKEGGGSLWWTKRPDVCVKDHDLTELFDSYDLVVLGDLRFVRSDQAAIKQGTTPAYVDAVEHTSTKVTTLSHGVAYNDKSAIFMDRIINAGNFTKTLLYTDAPYNTREHPVFSKFDVHIRMERMYRLRLQDPEVAHDERPVDVGTLGRFGSGKNLHIPMMAAAATEIGGHAEVWGACAAMMSETPSWALFDVLREVEGAEVEHLGEVKSGRVEYQSVPWSVQVKKNRIISYGGAFTEPHKIASRMGAFVNATRHGFSAGMEYATLEAMDAGCTIIIPDGMNVARDRYRLVTVASEMKARATARGSAEHDRELIQGLARHLDYVKSFPSVVRMDVAFHNRQAVRDHHDPATVGLDVLTKFMDYNG